MSVSKRSDYTLIPARIMDGITTYVEHGLAPGGFLSAVFENDLMKAVGRADDEVMDVLETIATYVYNQIPADCWGSRAKVDRWIKAKREEREERAQRGEQR